MCPGSVHTPLRPYNPAMLTFLERYSARRTRSLVSQQLCPAVRPSISAVALYLMADVAPVADSIGRYPQLAQALVYG